MAKEIVPDSASVKIKDVAIKVNSEKSVLVDEVPEIHYVTEIHIAVEPYDSEGNLLEVGRKTTIYEVTDHGTEEGDEDAAITAAAAKIDDAVAQARYDWAGTPIS